VVQEALAEPLVGRDLGQVDHRLDRLDLAEEGSDAAELVVPPVLEKPGGLGGHAPVARVADGAPLIDAGS
jgi:hypothetical protein